MDGDCEKKNSVPVCLSVCPQLLYKILNANESWEQQKQ